MATATWNGKVIAQSDDTIVIEGNHYFPPDSVNKEYFEESDMHTTCPWKGEASYFDIKVDEKTNQNAAWTYKTPKDTANEIVKQDFANYVAFWHGVEVEN